VDLEATELETLRQVFLDDADRCLTVLDESLVALERHPTDSEMLGTVSVSIELPASSRACGVAPPRSLERPEASTEQKGIQVLIAEDKIAISRVAALPDPSPALDEEALSRAVRGDVELVGDLLALFRPEAAAALDRIEQALSDGDPSGVAAAAHAIKGTLASLHARAAAGTAGELEEMGTVSDLDRWVALLARLRVQMRQVQGELEALIDRMESRTEGPT
jgi:HPt (histidine-containing phosphotransfer) domain-containing protein